MSEHDWKPVANALLGTWPSQVNSWGPEVLAAFCAELASRRVSPMQALLAIRSYDPDADFPPSAAKLALTTGLPRKPGVYLFRDRGGRVLYVGKATNLRARVR